MSLKLQISPISDKVDLIPSDLPTVGLSQR